MLSGENMIIYLLNRKKYKLFLLKNDKSATKQLCCVGSFFYLCTLMKKSRNTYNCKHITSSIGMILTLLWLTVSIPFVFEAQQKLQKNTYSNTTSDTRKDKTANPLNNTTEEKTPSSVNLTEEYIHHTNENNHPWFTITNHHRDYATSLYIAFHGELFCPPPNA